MLTRDDCKLVEQVRINGEMLRRGLEELQAEFPHMIAGIRGCGYMLGIEFDINRHTWSESMLGTFAEQGLFTPLFSSYLLNVEAVRVAPTLNGKSVVRIEPALTFTSAQCEQLLSLAAADAGSFQRRPHRPHCERDVGRRLLTTPCTFRREAEAREH